MYCTLHYSLLTTPAGILCHAHSFVLVFTLTANSCLNALIAKEVYDLLAKSHAVFVDDGQTFWDSFRKDRQSDEEEEEVGWVLLLSPLLPLVPLVIMTSLAAVPEEAEIHMVIASRRRKGRMFGGLSR
jgi:hypothetical protein